MMSAVPEPHDLHQPTAPLPVVEPRGVYRAANHRRTALIVVAGSTVVLLALTVLLFSGGDDPAPRAPVAAPAVPSAPASGTGSPAGSVSPAGSASPSESAEPSPGTTTESASPSATATARRPAQPPELIFGLAAVVDDLEDRDQLDDDDAEALTRRLEQAATRLSRGDVKGASRKIEDFTEKLRDLREDDDLSEDAFNLLNAGADQIGAVLPRD